MTVFMSGCLLRCLYCHNPDTWHLKDGTRVSFERAEQALAGYASALRAMDGGLTISAGSRWSRCISRSGSLRPPSGWASTRRSTPPVFSEREPTTSISATSISCCSTSSRGTRAPIAVPWARTFARRLQFAERLASLGKPVWVRFVLVPGLTDDPANVEGIARFVAPMRNVEWVEVLPFHQMGAFKWQAMGLNYELSDTPSPSPELVAQVMKQFRDAGCRAR